MLLDVVGGALLFVLCKQVCLPIMCGSFVYHMQMYTYLWSES